HAAAGRRSGRRARRVREGDRPRSEAARAVLQPRDPRQALRARRPRRGALVPEVPGALDRRSRRPREAVRTRRLRPGEPEGLIMLRRVSIVIALWCALAAVPAPAATGRASAAARGITAPRARAKGAAPAKARTPELPRTLADVHIEGETPV